MAYYTALRLPGMGLGATTTAGSAQAQQIAQAISVAEGYGQPGAIPTVRNNPGDIMGAGGVIQTFATPQQGWDALTAQVNAMITGTSAHYSPNMTWSQIGAIYANDPSGAWANNVANQLGVDPNSTLGDFLSGDGTGTLSSAPTGGFNISMSDPIIWIVGALGLLAVVALASPGRRAYA